MAAESDLYPMRYSIGMFFICVGIAVTLAGLFDLGQGNLFLGAGFVLGAIATLAMVKRAKERYGRPKRYQIMLLLFAVALEVAVIYFLNSNAQFQSLPDYVAQLVVLAVVSAHFMLMRWSFGPWVLKLGAATLLWVGLAGIATIPMTVVVAVYGILEFVFGVIMSAPLFFAQAAKAA